MIYTPHNNFVDHQRSNCLFNRNKRRQTRKSKRRRVKRWVAKGPGRNDPFEVIVAYEYL